MGLITDVARPYWLMAKMSILVVIAGYVGYLYWQIGSLERENTRLQGVVTECEEHAKDLTIQRAIQDRNIEKMQEYYRNKKCLDLRPGELRDEEFKLN